MSAQAQTMDRGRRSAAGVTDVFAPVVEAARGVWWTGLGLVVLAGEQGTKLLNAAMQRGKDFEPNLTEPLRKAGDTVESQFKNVGETVGGGASRVEQMVDSRISKTLSQAAKPLQNQLQSVSKRLDELDAKLEKLRKPAPRRARTKKT